jgi:hypothetical protein
MFHADKIEDYELSQKEHDEKQEFARNYNEIREAILKNKKGYDLGSARELFESLNVSDAKKVLETFYNQEGALPDQLGKEYIKLVYSPASLLEKMEEGKTFHEAVAAIASEVKNKHLELDANEVNDRIKESSKEIFEQAEDEK